MYMSARMEALLCELKRLGGTGLLLDVGCDHAYVAIEAIRRGLAEMAVASDINRLPLGAARKNIEAFGLSGRIDAVLSDGLKSIDEDFLLREAESQELSLLAAGMGGRLIRDILREAGDKLNYIKKLVLSPQSEPELVRSFLLEEAGFCIKDEVWVEDEGKVYVVISAARQSGDEGLRKAENCKRLDCKAENYHRYEYLFGRAGLGRRDPILKSYLERLLSDTEEALINAGRGSSEKASSRCLELEELRSDIKRALSCFEEDEAMIGGVS